MDSTPMNHREEFPRWLAENKTRIIVMVGAIMTVTVLLILAMAGYQSHAEKLAEIRAKEDINSEAIIKNQQAIMRQQKEVIDTLKAAK